MGAISLDTLEYTEQLLILAGFGDNYLRTSALPRILSVKGHRTRMATRRTTRPTPARSRRTSASVPAETKPVALTVKLDSKTYVRLCTLGATQRRTNQDLLKEAVHEYLDRIDK